MNQSTIIITVIITVATMAAASKPRGGAPCNTTDQCSNHGTCKSINGTDVRHCVCLSGYMDEDCSYQQHPRAVPANLQIGLSFILICGIGNIIVGNTLSGAGQLCGGIAVLINVIFVHVAYCRGDAACRADRNLKVSAMMILSFLFISAGPVWSIADGVRMLHDGYLDGNGYPLA